jgi:hypothetical protein
LETTSPTLTTNTLSSARYRCSTLDHRSMHSTLTSNQPLDFLLPSRQRTTNLHHRSHQERQEYGDDSSRSVKLQGQGAWTAPDGLRTPPEDMTGANLNPLGYGSRVHGNGYFPKPYSSSNSTSFGGFLAPATRVPAKLSTRFSVAHKVQVHEKICQRRRSSRSGERVLAVAIPSSPIFRYLPRSTTVRAVWRVCSSGMMPRPWVGSPKRLN